MTYSFNNILGNDQIKKTLRKSVFEKRFSHAYILEGAKGSGKSLLANCFANFIFCKTKEHGCTCHSCIQFEAGCHTDLIYVTSGGKKSIGVAPIREIISELSKKPFEYDNKIFIIEEAQLLTPEAQNALLRSIEEPPEYAVFILLTENINNMLPTVLSRCFIYKMTPFGNYEVYKHLVSLGLPEDKSKIVSGYSEGSIGKAISLCGRVDFFELRVIVNNVLADCGGDLETLFDGMRRLEEYKEFADDFIMLALLWFRDVLVYKSTGINEYVYQSDYLRQIINCAQVFSFKNLYLNVNGLIELKRGISANTPFSMALDAFTIKLGENR